MKESKAYKQYLNRYAEPEVKLLESLSGNWRQALVIPAYKEPPDFLKQNCFESDLLLILVLNRPESDENNRWATDIITVLGKSSWQNQHLSLHHTDNCNILLVDRCLKGPPLPVKQGVGLARKIGSDIACQLIVQNNVREHWFGSSDADATLPPDYSVALSEQLPRTAACIFPFLHTPYDIEEDSVRAYELHMLHYAAGLRYAGSPYSWPTIGSCVALNADFYVKARGFPKRSAGEDFYLLNKLAKLAGVSHLSGPVIKIKGRLSDRVPFGTGPALSRISALESLDDYYSYAPQSFLYLRGALGLLRDRAQSAQMNWGKLDPKLDADLLKELWEQFQCDLAIEKAYRNSRSEQQCLHLLMGWFDAFKTLKWIHASREFFPDKPLRDCLRDAPWVEEPDADFKYLSEQLQKQLADGKTHYIAQFF